MLSMNKFFRRGDKSAGLPPGTAVYTGAMTEEKIRITLFDYDTAAYDEKELKDIEECFRHRDSDSVSWINLDGIHNVEHLEKMGDHFELHPLVLEDIANPWQRPKLDDYDNYLYVVAKMLAYDDQKREIASEQVSFVLGKKFVLSFQERPGDIFEPIRERIRSGKGRIRRMGPDYLLYVLLDTIIDQYFSILEKVGEQIEELEETVMVNPKRETLQDIHKLKREMLYLRKSVWPLREVVSSLERYESPLVHKSTQRFIRDAYDHTIHVIEAVESFRDMLSGLHDAYLSSLSNRMNEIMKVLTIIATLFIPLTFIAGIYGMNFKFMPELDSPWGYPLVWLVMVLTAGGLLIFFKRKGWL